MPSTFSLDKFLAACQRPLRRSIRVSTLKISAVGFLALTTPYNRSLTPVPWYVEGFWVERDDKESVPLGSTAEHLSGLFYIREAGLILSVAVLLAEGNAPERVMDVAAALGSRTTQITTKMNNRGAILANEFSANHVKAPHINVSRYEIANVALIHFDGCVFGATSPELFDTILLNTLCSGEGMTRKDLDALKDWSAESNLEIVTTQHELLDSASHILCPGSTLVYSTRALNRDRSENIMQWSIETYPDAVEFLPLDGLFPQAERALTPEGFLHVFPQICDCEGFFVTRLRKMATIPALPAPRYKVGSFPSSPLKGREFALVTQAASACRLQWGDNLRPWRRDKEIRLFPTDIEPLIDKVCFSRLGIKLAETHSKRYHWQHETVIILANPNHSHAFELALAEVGEWYRGRDVYPQTASASDDVLITFRHQPIGLAKRIGP